MRLRPVPALVLVVLSLGLCLSVASVARADLDTRPIIVIREDDCRTSWRTPFTELGGMNGLQYGKSKRIPISWGIISDSANSSALSLTWAELKDYLDTCGGEPVSHSKTHTTLYSVQDYCAELPASKAAIETNLPGYHCTAFYQPGAWGTTPDSSDTLHADMDTFAELYNPIGLAIQSNYSVSMAYLGGGWHVGSTYYKYGKTDTYSVDYIGNPSAAAISATLDVVAATPGAVFIISCHGVQGVTETGPYAVRVDTFKTMMDKLAALRDSGQVRLMGLTEAYNTAFPSNLNHVYDPGFEVVSIGSLNPSGPWKSSGNTTIAGSGGVNNSRYCAIVGDGSALKSGAITLAPGRYEVSWYQRPEPGQSGKVPLNLFMSNSTTNKGVNCINTAQYLNTDPNAWERKKAYVMIGDQLPMATMLFVVHTGGDYGVDNVSMYAAPLDPAVSPSGSTAQPHPDNTCTISWTTPNSSQVASVCVRYNRLTYPLSPADGLPVGTIAAVPGANQSVTLSPIFWSVQDYLFFSVFAQYADGSFSPPDLVMVKVDKVGPTTPAVTAALVPQRVLSGSWQSADPDSAIYQYSYCIGSSPGQANLLPWTATTSPIAQAQLPSYLSSSNVYLSVKARNVFGVDSPVGYVSVVVSNPPGQFDQSDGSTVTVTANISAIFGDAFYVELPNRARAIRVEGSCPWSLGQSVTFTGTLATTLSGERSVVLSPPQ